MDGEKACFRGFVAGVIAAAYRAAQDSEASSEGAVAAGIGGSVDADDRLAQGAGKMQRASVSGDSQRYAAGEGDQLGERAVERGCRAVSLADIDSASGSSPGPALTSTRQPRSISPCATAA